MGERIKKLKKIRIHREGTDELLYTLFALIAIGVILWRSFSNPIPFIIFMAIFGSAWLLMLNFYRCPIRYFNGNTEKTVVAPAICRTSTCWPSGVSIMMSACSFSSLALGSQALW